jgi:hypothetical protein
MGGETADAEDAEYDNPLVELFNAERKVDAEMVSRALGFLVIVSYRWPRMRHLRGKPPHASDPPRHDRDRNSRRRPSGCRANARKSHDD